MQNLTISILCLYICSIFLQFFAFYRS